MLPTFVWTITIGNLWTHIAIDDFCMHFCNWYVLQFVPYNICLNNCNCELINPLLQFTLMLDLILQLTFIIVIFMNLHIFAYANKISFHMNNGCWLLLYALLQFMTFVCAIAIHYI